MQMAVMTFRSSLESEVVNWLDAAKVSYTVVQKAHGKGMTGHASGSTLWAGGDDNAVLFVAIDDEHVNDFRGRVQHFHRTLSRQGTAQVPFHVFVLPCIQWC